MRVRDGIDHVLSWLKWPVAVLSVVMLPAVVLASARLIRLVAGQPADSTWFLGGLAGYGVLWWQFLRHSRFGFLSTLEHELTHALFALATLHPVTRLRAKLTGGGYMQFRGRGNWLITAAPYFFPTVCVVLLPVCHFVPALTEWPGDLLMGAAFAYHITSALRETHPGQSDLKQLGWLFCLAFLPTANLISLGSVLSFVHGGSGQLWWYLSTVLE